MIGESIAHYSITAKIGAGGMGEVWRAKDAKLGRDVALKILPEIFSSDPQRMARFHREAQLLASLNHPNIAAIYGVEESDGRRALVLELVEGDDLSQRLAAGEIPLEETLDIARQIAEALEAAHEKGVVHRDLKPANVKLTPGGAVKVLDFGLAKALEGDPAAVAADPSQSLSPTLTVAATRMGVILGTAAYMSPEQAKGKAVDRRADIFSFGVVLFEMLAGRQCFAGETISDTLASVLKVEPDWDLLPTETPRLIVDLLRRCLEKDPKQRLQSIGEARITMQALARGTASTMAGSMTGAIGAPIPSAAVIPGPGAKQGPGRAVWAASLVMAAALAGAAVWILRPAPPDLPARRYSISPVDLQVEYRSQPVVSPDGLRVAYVAANRLWVRDLDKLQPREIQGSEGARAMSWSPDGASLAYVVENKLYKVAGIGGAPAVLTKLEIGRVDGTAWADDGYVYLAPGAGPMYRVSSQGGDAVVFIPLLAEGETDFHTPSALPEGRGLVYSVHRVGGSDTIEAYRDGERKVLLRIEGDRIENPVYASAGYLVYSRRTNNAGVWAAPFSVERLELEGDPFLLDPEGSYASVAADGSLVYSLGAGLGLRQLVWVDRSGALLGVVGEPQEGMTYPALSQDATRVLVSESSGDNRDIWIQDVERGTRTRATFGEEVDWSGTWLPGGERIAITSGLGMTSQTFTRAADGTDEPVKMGDFYLASFREGVPLGLATVTGEKGDPDLVAVAAEGGGSQPRPFLVAPARQEHAEISPDGAYVAYVSDESGQSEIYLKRFPSGEGKWQVSLKGGQWPRWSRDGKELYYVEASGNPALMAVKVTTKPSLRLSTPEKLFEERALTGLILDAVPRMYDVHPDGQRFLGVQVVGKDRDAEPRIVVTQYWLKAFGR